MSNDVHLAKVSKIQRALPKIPSFGRRKEDESDLSPDQTQSDNNISSSSTLDIVNLTQQQLEIQVRDLTKRLQKSEDDRISLERQLKECASEKDVCLRRLECLSTSHECRITEMHCVIAELSKKLRAKQENVIFEEQEPDGSEASYQQGSIYNSELNLTNPDAECQTDPLDSIGEDNDCLAEKNHIDYFDLNEQDMKYCDPINKGKVEALQEEVLHLRAQIALLQSEIANSGQYEKDMLLTEKQLEAKDLCKCTAGRDDGGDDSNCSSERLLFVESDKISSLNVAEQREILRVPKMAERVKLRCVSNDCSPNNVISTGLNNTKLANIKNINLEEELVVGFEDENICMVSDRVLDAEQYNKDDRHQYGSLQRKVESLKIQNTILTLTLEECKEHCEHLYLLCGKYESNATALQLALNFSDRAIEAYDVMLALLESKLALMTEKTVTAEESRKAVESVAQHLLDRLECEKNLCENSLGPWQSTFNITEKACMPWTPDDDNRLRYHVSKLKGCRSTVQNTIVNLESPFSDYYEKRKIAAFESSNELKNQERAAHFDLEIAVIMQELLGLREENFALKSKIEELQKERQLTTHRISILEGALNQLQTQLHSADVHGGLFQRDSTCSALENRVSYSEQEHTAHIEQQLVEALTRESELKSRIQTLIASVAATQKFGDDKWEISQGKAREVDSNLNVAHMLEQNKRKYQTRIRKLEQKISELTVHSDGNTATCSTKIHHDHVPETTL